MLMFAFIWVFLQEGAKVGDRIFFPGYEGEPEKELNPKKKIFETLKPVSRHLLVVLFSCFLSKG